MAFKKGKSGNPKGRPRGSKDKRTALRELLEPHAQELVKKVVELAKKGDTTALRMCLDRLIPPYRSKDPTVLIEGLGGTLTELGEQVIMAMAKGELSPTDAAGMLSAFTSQARIIEVDELDKRLRRLEESYGN